MVREQVSASKKLGQADALALVDEVSRVVAAKGRKHVVYDLKRDRPDRATLLSVLLGPTGNLRAPTARRGKTLFVGFNEEAWRELEG